MGFEKRSRQNAGVRTQEGSNAVVANVLSAIDGTPEWVNVEGQAGSSIQPGLSSPKTLNAIALHDRPNISTWTTSAMLTLAGGESITVGTLPNEGSPLVVLFPARTVSWVKFTVDSVSESKKSAGLTEIEALTAFAS